MRKSLKRKRIDFEFIVFQNFIRCLVEAEKKGEVDLFFYDESAFNLVPTVPYGWQKIGGTTELNSQRSPNINVLGFINTENELHYYTSKGSVNSELVMACFDDFISNRKKEIPLFIITDNAPTHKSKAFIEKVKQWSSKNCYVLYLPTYSPELNIIEILWRFMKYKWIDLDAYDSNKALEANIEDILSKIGTKYRIDFFNDDGAKKYQKIYA